MYRVYILISRRALVLARVSPRGSRELAPSPSDKILCRCFGAPATHVFPDALTSPSPGAQTANKVGVENVLQAEARGRGHRMRWHWDVTAGVVLALLLLLIFAAVVLLRVRVAVRKRRKGFRYSYNESLTDSPTNTRSSRVASSRSKRDDSKTGGRLIIREADIELEPAVDVIDTLQKDLNDVVLRGSQEDLVAFGEQAAESSRKAGVRGVGPDQV